MASFKDLLSQLAAEYDRVSDMNRALLAQVEGSSPAAGPSSLPPAFRPWLGTPQRQACTSDRYFSSETSSPRPSYAGAPCEAGAALERAAYTFATQQSKSLDLTPALDPLFNPLQVGKQQSSVRRVSMQRKLEQASQEYGCQEKARKCAIDPEHSQFLERWDRITIWALAFVSIVCPVQVSMFEAQFNAMFVINCLIDLVFLFDLVLQFFVMYPKRTKFNGIMLEQRQSHIAAHYLKSWFVIDLLSVVPFELISVVTSSKQMAQMKVVKVVRLLRLSKLMRVMRASRLWRRFQLNMSITFRQFALIRFFVVLLLITHWMANLWILTLVLVGPEEQVPRWVDHLTSLETELATKTEDSPFKLYVAAVYFTCYTLTSVGYGDIAPQNIVERVVCVLMLMISGTCWSIVLEQVCAIVGNMDVDEQGFRRTMDEIGVMMEERAFPSDLRQRLREYFLANKMAQRRARHQLNLLAVSPGLRGEVATEMNKLCISKTGLLRSLQRERETSTYSRYFYSFIVDVCLAMEWQAHAQSEMFGRPHILYTLSRGLVSRPPRLHWVGNVWGTDFVLSDQSLLDPWESMALTYVELTTLTRAAFFEVVVKYRVQCKAVMMKVRYLCCWFALQRTLWKEAKKRQRAPLSGEEERFYPGFRLEKGDATMLLD